MEYKVSDLPEIQWNCGGKKTYRVRSTRLLWNPNSTLCAQQGGYFLLSNAL